MNKVDAAKLGRIAVNKKYSEETRRAWSRKGALVLNSTLPNEYRIKGGKIQKKEDKTKGALNAMKSKKLNDLETGIIEILQRAGYSCSVEKDSDFELHSIIETKVRKFEFDFVRFKNGVPDVVIEVTSQKSEIKGESTAYKITKLKEAFPGVKTIAVVPSNMVNAGLLALKNEASHLVFLDNLHQLISVLDNS